MVKFHTHVSSKKMHSSCSRHASQACFHYCCSAPSLTNSSSHNLDSMSKATGSTAAESGYDPFYPHTKFTNHESLPSFHEAFSNFTRANPQYILTNRADKIRAKEYYHLSVSNHVCLDYIGHGLFSYSQLQQTQCSSSSSSVSGTPFFDISYKSVNLNSQMVYGGKESELELKFKKRIMAFMNISEDEYTVVFTANQSSAFKLVADTYPFESNRNLVTVYDYENEGVELMSESSKKRGARIKSAEFLWPNMGIRSGNLMKMITGDNKRKKKRTKGLFVFPLQSKVSGNRYSYLWMSIAQEYGWHVLLDASSLGPKDMDTLGLSIFKPDFLICSFFKVFGENPSGFGCLFVKKSSASVLNHSSTPIGIVSLIPATTPSQSQSQLPDEFHENEKVSEFCDERTSEIELKGLDDADKLGLILISNRTRCLINWLVNALKILQHPHSENGYGLVRIYGPKWKSDRGPALAFNVFDWKGEQIDPLLVQKLADRHNISFSCGILKNIWFREGRRTSEVEGRLMKNRERSVVTAAIGFLTDFEDIYRVWAFVSRFLDADYVEKERWRYLALDQKTIEV